MRRTVRLFTTAALMAVMVALVFAGSACGGGDRGAQTEQEQNPGGGGKAAGGRTQKEQPSQGEQPTQQDALERPAQKKTVIIKITGNARYYCTVGLIDSSRTVEGRAPATYKLRVVPGGTSLDTVMAVCQQTGARGPLGARILYDGEVKAQEQTNAHLGTVAVSWSPVEE